jgi:hypothetical protein
MPAQRVTGYDIGIPSTSAGIVEIGPRVPANGQVMRSMRRSGLLM